jgi:hypothetical protein
VTGMSRVLAGEPDAVRCPFPHYRSATASLDDIRLAQADSPPDLDLSSYLTRGIRSLPLTFHPAVRPEAALISC